jgi:prophage maintenance system killer protein
MIWVTAEDVVAIHSRIIQVSGGIDGLRDRAGLEAAIAAPLQSFCVRRSAKSARPAKLSSGSA